MEPARGGVRIALPGPGAARDLPDILTAVVGLTAGAVGRALVHGGAVLGPTGRVWILAGPSGSGKSTATANLVRDGWHYLSDDRVFLRREGEGAADVRVEGWLRPFLLDPRRPEHPRGIMALPRPGDGRAAREPVDPGGLGAGSPCAEGPLGGILFPRVVASGKSRAHRVDPGETLRLLIRESPWLLGSPTHAARGLALLADAASVPAYRLRLAPDTRRDPARLGALFRRVVRSDAVSAGGDRGLTLAAKAP